MSVGSYILGNLPAEKYPGASNEEVVLHYKAGECTFDQVIRRFHYLLVGKCKVSIPGMDEDDIYQELLLKLLRSCDGWKPDKEISFSTYLYSALDNHIRRLIRSQLGTEKRKGDAISVSLDETTEDEDGGVLYKYEVSVEFHSVAEELPSLNDLTPRELRVVSLLLSGYSKTELSRMMNLSKSSITHICHVISAKLCKE